MPGIGLDKNNLLVQEVVSIEGVSRIKQKKEDLLVKKLLLILLAVVMLFSLAGCGAQPAAEEPAEDPPPVAEEPPEIVVERPARFDDYFNPDALVSVEQAQAMLAAGENVVVIDVRRIEQFLLGHIAGAVNVWRGDYSAAEGVYPFGGMRNTREEMAELLGNLGIDSETKIIVTTHEDMHDGARFYWQLLGFGHPNTVLMDGGMAAWNASNLPIKRALGRPDPEPVNYRFPYQESLKLLATLDDVKAATDDPDVIILDTRSFEEFTGEKQKTGATRAGRIPTSVWVEFSELIDDNSLFKPYAELKAMFEAKGITADKTVIPYCQSGVRSSLTTFALTELLGFENVKNYDGSWIEWSFHEDLPIETGPLN